MALLTREQLEARLVSLHRASLELIRDLSLDTVLNKIITLARDEVNAAYGALGVLDDQGNLVQFIPVGMAPEQEREIGHLPVGLGLIGALKNERRTIRLSQITDDPRSVGFPPHHPYMESFLGVPIVEGNKLFGLIYLTNKLGYSEFSTDDERVIEMLAAYAAVAISHARMYEAVLQRDDMLVRQNEDLALLNDVATTLTSSTDLDVVLDKTLTQSLHSYILMLEKFISAKMVQEKSSLCYIRVDFRNHCLLAIDF